MCACVWREILCSKSHGRLTWLINFCEFRKAHGSIIVSSGRLVTELTTNFQCKRLIVRRQSPSSIWKKSPHLFTTRPVVDKHGEAGDTGSAWTSGIGGPTRKSQNSLNQNIQVHCVSNRILKKVRGAQKVHLHLTVGYSSHSLIAT